MLHSDFLEKLGGDFRFMSVLFTLQASWSDDDSVTVSYTSPNKMILKLSRLSSDKIRKILEEDEMNMKKATAKRKARKVASMSNSRH